MDDAEPTESIARRELRSKRNFRLMWAGESVSFFGSLLTTFALPLIALTSLHVGSALVPLIAVSSGAGTVLLLLVLSPLADHPARRRVMIALNLVRLVTMAALAVILTAGGAGFAAVCVAAFVIAGCGGVYDSAFAGLVPEAIAASRLQRANAWFGAMHSAGNIGAGGIGGVLLQLVAAPVVLLLDAATYLLALLALLGLRLSAGPTDIPRTKSPIGYSAGFRALASNATQRAITAAIAHFNFFTTAIQSMLIVYAVRSLGLNAFEVGIGMTVGGIIGLSGVAVAAPALARLTLGQVLPLTFALPGLLAAGLVVVPAATTIAETVAAVGWVAVVMGVWSICVIVNMTGTETLKQLTVERGVLGRFSSAVKLITWGVDPLGALAAAALLGVFEPRVVMIVLALGVMTSAFWVLRSRVVRELPHLDCVKAGSGDGKVARTPAAS